MSKKPAIEIPDEPTSLDQVKSALSKIKSDVIEVEESVAKSGVKFTDQEFELAMTGLLNDINNHVVEAIKLLRGNQS